MSDDNDEMMMMHLQQERPQYQQMDCLSIPSRYDGAAFANSGDDTFEKVFRNSNSKGATTASNGTVVPAHIDGRHPLSASLAASSSSSRTATLSGSRPRAKSGRHRRKAGRPHQSPASPPIPVSGVGSPPPPADVGPFDEAGTSTSTASTTSASDDGDAGLSEEGLEAIKAAIKETDRASDGMAVDSSPGGSPITDEREGSDTEEEEKGEDRTPTAQATANVAKDESDYPADNLADSEAQDSSATLDHEDKHNNAAVVFASTQPASRHAVSQLKLHAAPSESDEEGDAEQLEELEQDDDDDENIPVVHAVLPRSQHRAHGRSDTVVSKEEEKKPGRSTRSSRAASKIAPKQAQRQSSRRPTASSASTSKSSQTRGSRSSTRRSGGVKLEKDMTFPTGDAFLKMAAQAVREGGHGALPRFEFSPVSGDLWYIVECYNGHSYEIGGKMYNHRCSVEVDAIVEGTGKLRLWRVESVNLDHCGDCAGHDGMAKGTLDYDAEWVRELAEFKREVPKASPTNARAAHDDSGHASDACDEEGMDIVKEEELELEEEEVEDSKPDISSSRPNTRGRASATRSSSLNPSRASSQAPARNSRRPPSASASTKRQAKRTTASRPNKRIKSETLVFGYDTPLADLDVPEAVIHLLERMSIRTLGSIPIVANVQDWLCEIAYKKKATSRSFLGCDDEDWSEEENQLYNDITSAATLINQALTSMA